MTLTIPTEALYVLLVVVGLYILGVFMYFRFTSQWRKHGGNRRRTKGTDPNYHRRWSDRKQTQHRRESDTPLSP